ncbi:MAG: nuclear transport factor 2 family protein [Rhodospirillales bacterium]|nr:nuclear transport factor 2 family protein [Rhodospirillales bacterium]
MTDAAQAARALVHAYYDAFNAGDRDAFLALLAEDVVHDISGGAREIGREAFARFMSHMDRCYRERIDGLVVMTEPTGTQAAATFTVHGVYVATDHGVPPGTPPARSQTYVLPAAAFFRLRGGRIAAIANHYRMEDWVAQISEGGGAAGP